MGKEGVESACRKDTAPTRTSRRRRSDAKSTTFQHSAVSFKLLRTAPDWGTWSYDAEVPLEVLDRIADKLELEVQLPSGPHLMEVEVKDTHYIAKLPGFWLKIVDPRRVAKVEAEGYRKPSAANNRPVLLVAQGTPYTLYGASGVRTVRRAVEQALWGGQGLGRIPEPGPGMFHLALDIEVRGRERDTERFLGALFSSPRRIKDSWCRRSVKDVCIEFGVTKGGSNRGQCRELTLGSRSTQQIAIYTKSEELARKPADYRAALTAGWRDAGWDGERTVLRVEVRTAQEWMRKQKLPDGRFMDELRGDEIEAHFESVVKAAVERNRFCPGRGDKRRRPDHPFWSFIRECLPMLRVVDCDDTEVAVTAWDTGGYEPAVYEAPDLVRRDRDRRAGDMIRRLSFQTAALADWVNRPVSEVTELLADVALAEHDAVERYSQENGYHKLAEERWLQDQLGHPSATTTWLRVQGQARAHLDLDLQKGVLHEA